MVRGITNFKKRFQGYEEQYMIIVIKVQVKRNSIGLLIRKAKNIPT